MKNSIFVLSVFLFACSDSQSTTVSDASETIKYTTTKDGSVNIPINNQDGSAGVVSDVNKVSLSDTQIDAEKATLFPSTILACSVGDQTDCGGDIVGNWKAVGLCDKLVTQENTMDKFSRSKTCNQTIDLTSKAYVIYRNDGTFEGFDDHFAVITYDEECVKQTGYKCINLGSCVAKDGTCTCTYLYNPPTFGVIKGTYTLSNNQYITKERGYEAAPGRSYCIKGNFMSVKTLDMNYEEKSVLVYERVSDNPTTDAGTSIFSNLNDAGKDK